MKLGLYFRYATRSLHRGGQRTLLALFCVTVGVMAIVSLQLVGNSITSGLLGDVRDINGGDIQLTASGNPFTTADLAYMRSLQSDGTITGFTAIDIQRAQARVAGSSANQHFNLAAVHPATFPLVSAPVFIAPARARLGSILQGDTVVITTDLAQILRIQVGDTVHVSVQDGRLFTARVGGIVESSGYFQGAFLLVNYTTYAAIPGTEKRLAAYNQAYVDVPGHTDAAAASVEQQLAKQMPLVSLQTTRQLLASNQDQVDQIVYFLQIIGLVALLIGGVGIMNTIQVMLRRRQVEIAMLKSTGYRRRDLYGLFALETGLLGLLGGALGTAAGVAISFLVKALMQSTFGIALPTIIGAPTLGAGILVGLATSLIFGLLPIARASQVRPQVVLRELPEPIGWRGRVETGLLVLLLLVMFFLLSAAVLQNPLLAALVVGGTAAFLGLLAVFFGLVTWVISVLPVPGALPLPRQWRANLKLALRNVGRQRARTVTTLLALYIGVFAIGLVLVLGQDIQSSVTHYLASNTDIDAAILVTGHDKPAVDRELAHTSGVTHQSISLLTSSVPVSVNGDSIATFIQQRVASGADGQYVTQDVIGPFSSIQGSNLADGQLPDRKLVTVVKGSRDSRVGRLLTSADAGTTNVLLPVRASQAPDFLKLGDTLTLAGPAGGAVSTVRIIGFYTARLQFGQILSDSRMVNALSGGHPTFVYDFYIDPQTADVSLARIADAVPGIQTYSLGDILAQVGEIVGKLTTLLVTLASLAMLAAFITIANSVALAMLERRRDVGILKAVGHTSMSVLAEILLENGGIGLIAGVLGMLVVAASVPLLGSDVFGFSFGTPATIVALVVASSTAACMLIAVLVAWKDTRLRPIEVLRYE